MIKISPESGSEAYETLKQLELRNYTIEGMGFFVTNLGFKGWLRCISPDNKHHVMIRLSGRDEAKWDVITEKSIQNDGEPDPCDVARDFQNDFDFANQPTAYDP